AVYTGLAIGSTGQGNFLYAANVPAGRIDVFDRNFALMTPQSNAFVDPMLPAGFVPFNVQNINSILFVAYRNRTDRDHGGLVDEFDTSGRFIKRFATGGTLNGPWGLTVAPANFGSFGGTLLVGNFGDGRINAFNLNTGAFLGQLTDTGGQPIVLERLWTLTTGNGVSAGARNTVYLAAGIRKEQNGEVGSLRPANANERFLGQVYQDLLQRPIDATGLATWTNMLAQGASRMQVVQTIERTPEYRTVVVQSFYRTFLHRAADSG